MDKQFLNSQTIRGGLQLVFIVLGLVGVQVSDGEQESLMQAIIQIVAGVWALWSFIQVVRGRLNANRNIRLGDRKL